MSDNEKIMSFYEIVSGQIDNPVIEVNVGNEAAELEGDEARCFAMGYLSGLEEMNRINMQTIGAKIVPEGV